MAWTSAVPITIDHTKVAATLSAFPLFFTGIFAQLATVANGGIVTSSLGYDIIFATDSAGLSPIAFERQAYASTTGEVAFWVNIASLSSTADTVIYILFGNSSITTDQATPSLVWDSNYKAVYHLSNAAAVILTDSTSNADTLLAFGAPTKVRYGAAFDGTSQAAYTATVPMTVVDNFTMSCWALATSVASESVAVGNGWGNITSGGTGYKIETSSGVWNVLYDGIIRKSSGVAVSLQQWTHLELVRSSGTSSLYINGVLAGTTWANTPNTPAIMSAVGAAGLTTTPTFNGFWPGNVAEARFSNTPRSLNWILTEYRNQFSPHTFYSLGLTNLANNDPWGPANPKGPSFVTNQGPSGSRHQIVVPQSPSIFSPSHFNPVPVAANLAGGAPSVAYSETINAQGGTSPYTFAVTSGALPTGTTLNSSSGVISGTPSAASTFSFTITVTDSLGFTGSQAFQIIIAVPSSSGGGSFTFLS